MKCFLNVIVCLLISTTLLFSCGHHPYPHSLLLVDSLAVVNPDSALSLLKQLSSQNNHWDETETMYYRLLCIKVADNRKQIIPDANAITSIVDYYESKNDTSLLPYAYYYAGRTYSELQDNPAALEYFRKAATAVKDNPSLRRNIHIQIQKHLLHPGLYGDALRSFQNHLTTVKADSIQTVSKDLHDRNIVVNAENILQQALDSLKEALLMQAKYDNDQSTQHKDTTLAKLYEILGKNEYALLHTKSAYDHISDVNKYAIYKTLSLINTFHDDNISPLNGVKGEIVQNSYNHYKLIHDSLLNLTYKDEIAKSHALYSYQQHKSETQQLKTNNKLKKQLIYISILLISILFFLVIHYRKKQRKAELMLRLSEQLKNSVGKDEDSDKRAIEDGITQSSVNEQLNERELKALKQSDIYWKFMEHAERGSNPSKDEWIILEKHLDNICNSFATKLRIMCNLSERDFRMCLLIRIRMSLVKVANILHIDKTSLSSQRRRLYKRYTGTNGSSKDWDTFILSL